MKLVMLAMMMCVIACEKTSSNIYVSSCLPLVKYTQKQQNDVADAMEASPNEAWVQMINDYGKLRKQARAACGENI